MNEFGRKVPYWTATWWRLELTPEQQAHMDRDHADVKRRTALAAEERKLALKRPSPPAPHPELNDKPPDPVVELAWRALRRVQS